MPEKSSKRPESTTAHRRSDARRRKAAPSHLLGEDIHEYSRADLIRLFRLPAALVDGLARARYVALGAGGGPTGYSFQDLLMFRAASALRAAEISIPKIIAALGNLRSTLPPGSLLTTMALAASATGAAPGSNEEWESKDEGALQDGQEASHPGRSGGTTVARHVAVSSQPPAHVQADTHYARGHALEESDVVAARAAYLDALNAQSDHLDARINLGRLLHLAGELKEAEQIYRAAKTSSALLSFNLAILLEDLNREEDAVAAYREALAQDPSLYDAHFNLSRLHERAQRHRDALRHLLAYRRHVSRDGDSP